MKMLGIILGQLCYNLHYDKFYIKALSKMIILRAIFTFLYDINLTYVFFSRKISILRRNLKIVMNVYCIFKLNKV